MVIIIGELINTSRKEIEPMVVNKDAAAIQDLAKRQLAAGAHYIDVNAGTLVGQEPESLKWLTETVQAAVDAPLCLDSPDPEALRAALKVHKGKAMINSITGEKERYESVLPLVLEYQAAVVALCMDDTGMPQTHAERVRISTELIEKMTKAGVPAEDIYLDPLVRPISTDTDAAIAVIDTIDYIASELSPVHTVVGLSNVSFGLPNRKLLNQAFFILAMGKGLDGVILDPLDNKIMAFFRAAQALLNKDEFCMEYLKAARAGILD